MLLGAAPHGHAETHDLCDFEGGPSGAHSIAGYRTTYDTSAVPQLDAAMKKYGKLFDYKIYPGAPHAFNSDTSPQSYREDAAKEAWGRTLEFLKKNLQS